MRWTGAGLVVVLVAACFFLSLGDAWAIHSADLSGPASGGAEIGTGTFSGVQGLPTSSGTHYVFAGDVEVGFHTRFTGPLYSAVELDSVSANEPTHTTTDVNGLVDRQSSSTSITTLGLMQDLADTNRFAFSVEGGGSVYVLNQEDTVTDYSGATVSPFSTSSTHGTWGGFVGGRASVRIGPASLTGLLREHFHSSQAMQVGIGLSGLLPHQSHFGWQIDYQYFGSSSSHANVIAAGVRIIL